MATLELPPLNHADWHRAPARRWSTNLILAFAIGAVLLAAGGVAAGATLATRVAGDLGGSSGAPAGQGNGAPAAGGQSTDPSGQGGAGATGDASDSQSVGMVEITSTLDNGTAAGTGMILSADGKVVTNHHVIAGATSIEVTVVSTGDSYQAEYVGSDSERDVAVLQLDGASGLSTINTDTNAVSVGDAVTAVGDANGDGGTLTAATGTVAAVDQSINVQDDDGSSHALSGLIQMRADIVPGDSGGAVLDSQGDAVGMNVAASSNRSDLAGYAIPMSTVMSVVDQVGSGSGSAGGSGSSSGSGSDQQGYGGQGGQDYYGNQVPGTPDPGTQDPGTQDPGSQGYGYDGNGYDGFGLVQGDLGAFG